MCNIHNLLFPPQQLKGKQKLQSLSSHLSRSFKNPPFEDFMPRLKFWKHFFMNCAQPIRSAWMDLLALQDLLKLLSLELRLKITILQPIILYLPWNLNQKRLLKTHIGFRLDPHNTN